MKVKMLVSLTGTRDGIDWPRAGADLDLPDAEARDLIAGGLAAKPAVVEAAAPTKPETAALKTTPTRRARTT